MYKRQTGITLRYGPRRLSLRHSHTALYARGSTPPSCAASRSGNRAHRAFAVSAVRHKSSVPCGATVIASICAGAGWGQSLYIRQKRSNSCKSASASSSGRGRKRAVARPSASTRHCGVTLPQKLFCSGAVSYTHLDVYKRQLPVLSYPWRAPLWWLVCWNCYLTT